ncbi:MAG: LamG domain-containing protein [bacterium]
MEMKFTTIAYTVSLLTVGLGLAVNGYSQSFLTNGLVAYYPFNGNANDESGQAQNGVVVGTSVSPTTNHLGVSNGALHFGGGSYVSVTPTPFNVNSNWTISFWCILDANAGPQNFVSTGNDAQSGVNMRYFYGQPGFWQYASGNNGINCNATNAATSWNMFTCSINGHLLEMFLNNIRIISTNNVFGTSLDAGSLWFGREEQGFPYDLVGSLSDIRIYNRALSYSEIQQLYAYESVPPACSPHKAAATATLYNGFVVGATITDGGCGYSNTPAVLIQGGGGSGATATGVVSNGMVVNITITDAGVGYTSTPNIVIGSPPFVPTVSIAVSKVKVTENVVLGRTYVLEASADLITWTATGPQFTAQEEVIVQEFDVDVTGRFFRIRQVR